MAASVPPPPPVRIVQPVPAIQSYTVAGRTISLSAPIPVKQSETYLWFPALLRLPNGKIAAVMQTYPDTYIPNPTALVMWSDDDGASWRDPTENDTGCYDSYIPQPSGDLLVLPYLMKPKPGGMGAPCAVLSHDKREMRLAKEEATVTGWPKPDKSLWPDLGLSGFCFWGPVIKDTQGKYLVTLYGYFAGTTRYTLVLAESTNGLAWTIRSIIADDACKLEGANGPCEAALCRLKDGRLLCVYRMGNGWPYGQSWSSDDGKTWTEPAAMPGIVSADPCLTVLPDGMVVLSGGRPGLFLWLNADGTGKTWDKIDIQAHHNRFAPEEKITQTSCYTRVIALDKQNLLYIYDRTAPDYRVWVVRIHIE